MKDQERFPDGDDCFVESRMSFGDHLEELRLHLWRAIVGFGVIVLLVFVADAVGMATGTTMGVGRPVFDVLSFPVERELQRFYDRRIAQVAREIQQGKVSTSGMNELRDVAIDLEVNEVARELAPRLGIAPPEPVADSEYVTFHGRIPPMSWSLALQAAQRSLGKRPSLSTMNVSEGMIVYLKVALGCGLVLGSPWIFWQIWSFVALGLFPHERRWVWFYLPFSLGLFLAGVLVCQFLVIPRAIEALLWFNEWLDLEPDLRLNEWLGFAVLMPLVFGVSFQTPLVMQFTERLGLLSVDAFRSNRRLAWFLLAIFAAVISPSVDFLSLLFLWLPMGMLYELGIHLCVLFPPDDRLDSEEDPLSPAARIEC